jgi:hypothetical protein
MHKDNTNAKRISVVEDKRTKGLVSALQAIADIEQISISSLIKKALSNFVRKHKEG